MNYATIKKFDIANGPGVRVSLFVSGCRHHCKNCFNSEAWDFGYGKHFTDKTADEIIAALKPDYVTGFSLLGGEPFEPENQKCVLSLLCEIKEKCPQKTVWCYTGFEFQKQLLNNPPGNPETVREILRHIDILVDGKFIEAQKSPDLIFRGSSNQQIIDVKRSLTENRLIEAEGVWKRKMGSGNIYD